MDKSHRIISVVLIVLSFIAIAAALFCIFASVGAQYGIFDALIADKETETFVPADTKTEETTHPPKTEPLTDDETPSHTLPPVTTSPGKQWRLTKTSDAGEGYQNGITFLGDSTTHGMISYEVLKDGKNTSQVWYGSSGNTITFGYVNTVKIVVTSINEEMTIKEAAALEKPKILLITLGVTGGVSTNMSKEQFTETYRELITSIFAASPDTQIIIQSIYPVAKTLTDEFKAKISNEKIIEANKWIEETVESLAETGYELYYLDTYSEIIGSDGFLPDDYSNGDGLHLSAKGYEAVLKSIRTHRISELKGGNSI